ncbi:hypothetical protein OIU78_015974 [Salix suchowensis]|nr:hypothetical protein OIU78_015974 [Salix suchowensis]
MEANREEVDPSGQELIEGSTIAEVISSVNHTAPSPSAPPIEGIVNLSDDQRRERKRAADKRYNEKKKRNEAELMKELGVLAANADALVRENDNLKKLRGEMEDMVKKENQRILSQSEDNNAGQNTEVQEARINFTGETSTGQDGLNEVREVNQASITSNADTISGENASMNLQTAQPAGSSGLPDDKQARKRVADKKYRKKRKCTLDEAAERTTKLKEQNANLAIDNAVLKAETNQLRKQLGQLRDISKMLNSKFSQQDNSFLGLTVRMPFYFYDALFYLYLLSY